MNLIVLNGMKRNPEFGGCGYLGHQFRSIDTDKLVIEAVNLLGINEADTFLWVNSRCARHFMNQEPSALKEFVREFYNTIPELKREVANG